MLTVGEGGTKFVGVMFNGLTFFQKYGFNNFYIINMAALLEESLIKKKFH